MSGTNEIAIKAPTEATQTTGEKIGNKDHDTVRGGNGRTAIGSSAEDAGQADGVKSGETMKKFGLDKFGVHEGDEANKFFPKGDKDLKDHFEDKKSPAEPSDEDRKEAQRRLEKSTSELIPPEDKKVLGQLQSAILNGDTKAFGDTIAQFKDHPEKLDAFLKEMNRNLEANGSETRAKLDSKGNVLVYGSGDTAVSFSRDGSATVHDIQHRKDGSVVMGGEIVGGADVANTFKQIGNSAVSEISGQDRMNRGDSLPSTGPFQPGHNNPPIWWKKIEGHPLNDLLKQ